MNQHRYFYFITQFTPRVIDNEEEYRAAMERLETMRRVPSTEVDDAMRRYMELLSLVTDEYQLKLLKRLQHANRTDGEVVNTLLTLYPMPASELFEKTGISPIRLANIRLGLSLTRKEMALLCRAFKANFTIFDQGWTCGREVRTSSRLVVGHPMDKRFPITDRLTSMSTWLTERWCRIPMGDPDFVLNPDHPAFNLYIQEHVDANADAIIADLFPEAK